jgi:hypothetical protein
MCKTYASVNEDIFIFIKKKFYKKYWYISQIHHEKMLHLSPVGDFPHSKQSKAYKQHPSAYLVGPINELRDKCFIVTGLEQRHIQNFEHAGVSFLGVQLFLRPLKVLRRSRVITHHDTMEDFMEIAQSYPPRTP